VSAHLQRAIVLFQQSRLDLAETELRQALATDPHDAYAHALLALSLAHREQFKEATEEAQQAIHLAPDFAFAHYALASIWHDRNHLPEATASIEEAIRLDPADSDYHALLAQIRLDQRQWPGALEAAERGLALDSEHVSCTNLRAIALVKLGRKAEAGTTIDAALAKNPENSVTHANQGWTLLEQRNPAKALEHFRESLRLDPENEWARQGIVEALKARHFIYALMLRYFLWMAKLSPNAQWGIIIGGYFANRVIGGISTSHPDLAPWLLPLRILYVGFALLTWTAEPLFNLLLRLNRFGRMALSEEQIRASNWMGGCMLGAMIMLGLWLPTQNSETLFGALVFGLLIIPLAGTFKCQEGWPRRMMTIYTVVMAAMGLGSVCLGLFGPRQMHTLQGGLLGLFLLGAFLSGWVANALMMVRLKR
jgi:tetratricopeptide (TPR) repeat protein